MRYLLSLYKLVLDILFPLYCVACKKHIETDALGPICGYCLEKITINRSNFQLASEKNRFKLFSVGNYADEALRALIYALKYDKILTAAKAFKLLAEKYLADAGIAEALGDEVTIIPIPLHPKKRKERGFNQAEIIADILSKHTGTEVRADLLKRIKYTKPQISFSSDAGREKNIAGAFALAKVGEEDLRGRNIIIVDDVYTSGNTIREAANILKILKPKSISAFVMARRSAH